LVIVGSVYGPDNIKPGWRKRRKGVVKWFRLAAEKWFAKTQADGANNGGICNFDI